MMNGRDRIKTAMQMKQPDRVPFWCLLSLEHIIRNGTPDGEYPVMIDDLIRAECQMAKRYHFDGVIIYLPAIRENTRVYDLLKGWVGAVPHGDPSHDFKNSDPSSWKQEIPEYRDEDFYSILLAREILGDDFHIGGWTPDGFSRAIQWFPTMEEAMIALIEDPERFREIVRFFDEQSIAWAKAQIELGGAESIQVSSPYAGSSFISPHIYKDIVLPSVKKLAESIKPLPAFSYVHTCGFLSDRLELLASSGADGMECLDPPPLGDVELTEAKKRVGGKIFLKGNLDSVHTLLYGSNDDVDQSVMKCLEAGMPAGGYILSSACSVAPAVSPERIIRISELVERHGYYE
jgi:uroporphyrinogen-III decarboxylase